MRDDQVTLLSELTHEETDLAMRETGQTFQCSEGRIGPGAVMIGMPGDGEQEKERGALGGEYSQSSSKMTGVIGGSLHSYHLMCFSISPRMGRAFGY